MKKNIVISYLVLICSFAFLSKNVFPSNGENDINMSTIIQTAQRAYYINNDYEKAITILTKASTYLQLKSDSKYEDIVDVNWEQIQITLYEKGMPAAMPLLQNLMKTIGLYHSKLPAGFTSYDNAKNLLLCENISKNFLYYPDGTKAISFVTDEFIRLYQKDVKGGEYVRMFTSSKSFICLLDGNKQLALTLSSDIMNKADDLEKCMYAINFGHALFANYHDAEKSIAQYKLAIVLDEETIYKTLLMDFQTLRKYDFDLSALSVYENQIRSKYTNNKHFKKPYIKEVGANSLAEKVGLKVGDVIESYNNEIIYDIEMFSIERRSERFKTNLENREIKVLRNGQHLIFKVAPGLLGIRIDYK